MFIRMHIQLTQQQMKALHKLAEEQNVSVSALIRQGVDMVIQSSRSTSVEIKRQRAIGVAGQFTASDNAPDVSGKHDQYLDIAYH